uniref:Rhodanese-like domain-containing protein 19 n=1 Tax=Cucumis melo TaxID=3656 RepID=A0A9I9E192_CUCME
MERTVDVRVAKDLLEKGHLYLDVRFDPIESDSSLMNKSSKESRLSSTSYIHVKEGRSYSSGKKKKKNYSSVSPLLYPNADPIACNSGGRSLRACVDLLNAIEIKLIVFINGICQE